jgi:hypothetical protein
MKKKKTAKYKLALLYPLLKINIKADKIKPKRLIKRYRVCIKKN